HELLEARDCPSTYFVTTTADDHGPLIPTNLPLLDALVQDEFDARTLRAAMEAAEAHPGFDTIKFKIPIGDAGYNGQWWTIHLGPAGVHPEAGAYDPRGEDLVTGAAMALPPITDGVLIDGWSQPSYTGTISGTVGSGIVPGVAP